MLKTMFVTRIQQYLLICPTTNCAICLLITKQPNQKKTVFQEVSATVNRDVEFELDASFQ